MRTKAGSFWLFSSLATLATGSLSACGPAEGGPDQSSGGAGGTATGGAASGGKFSSGDGGSKTEATGGRSSGGASGGTDGELGGAAGAHQNDGPTCAEGSFDHDAREETACQAWSTCDAGTFVAEAGTPTSDVVCEPCAAGTFASRVGAPECEPCAEGTFSAEGASVCRRHRECDWDEVQTAAGTTAQDVVCEPGSIHRQFGTAADDEVRGVAGGPDGGVYVAGGTSGALSDDATGDEDAFLRLYDASGQIVWTRQFGVVGADRAEQVAVDGLGNVMVVSTVDDARLSGGARTVLHAFDRDGEVLFETEVDGDGPCLARRLAVGRGGEVVIAGVTPRMDEGAEAGDADLCVHAYDSLGELVWARQAGSTEEDGVGGVALLGDGRALVVGFTDGLLATEAQGGRDAFVWTLLPDGTDEQVEQFGTVESDAATAVAAEQMGFVVVGWTTGELAAAPAGGADLFARHYRTLGSGTFQVTTTQLGTVADEVPTAVAALGRRVVLTSSVVTAEGSDGNLIVLSRNGGAPYQAAVGTPADDVPTGVAWGPGAHVFVGGTTAGAFVGESFGSKDGFVGRWEVPPGL